MKKYFPIAYLVTRYLDGSITSFETELLDGISEVSEHLLKQSDSIEHVKIIVGIKNKNK